MRRGAGIAVLLCGVVAGAALVISCTPGASRRDGAIAPEIVHEANEEDSSLSVNAVCCMCHMTFIREELSKTHLDADVTCVRCHGVSAGHANDEDIGATPPDKSYGRDEVSSFCRECHEHHDVPPEQVVALWVARRPPASGAVCTDCHGTHRIESAASEETASEASVDR